METPRLFTAFGNEIKTANGETYAAVFAGDWRSEPERVALCLSFCADMGTDVLRACVEARVRKWRQQYGGEPKPAMQGVENIAADPANETS